MVELSADRLVLVDDGMAVDYDGSMDDYIDFVLDRKPAGERGAKSDKPKGSKKDRKAAARAKNIAREEAKKAKAAIGAVEKAVAKLEEQGSAIDRAMFEPAGAPAEFADLNMGELAQRRAKITAELEAKEAEWLELSERVSVGE